MEHQSVSRSPARLAFVCFLRTGIRLPESVFAPVAAALEAKFNPYHDPENGQFTFAPGGGGGAISDGVYRPYVDKPKLVRTAGSGPPRGIGGNGGPPLDPLMLEHAFPGLREAPAGGFVAAADTFLDLTGASTRLTSELSLAYKSTLISQIQKLDPSYRYDSLVFPDTFDGQIRMINDLRWDRAAVIYQKTGSTEPLQLETVRYLQDRTDAAYDRALAARDAGKLRLVPDERIAIGNFVDRATREDLRAKFNGLAISTAKGGSVRINAREYDTSRDTPVHSRPDARIGDLALDVTLQRKGLGTQQVIRFFGSDFKPKGVVIVRPRQIDPVGTYMIKRPGR